MFENGKILNERYEIKNTLRPINSFFEYYSAIDREHDLDVVVIVLKKEFCIFGKFVSDFQTAAREMIDIRDRNIVSVLDFGCDQDNHYMVLELVEGITLENYLWHKQMENGLSCREAISIAIWICQGLKVAADRKVIHGTLLPGNVLINTDGVVKVTGFNLPYNGINNNKIQLYYKAPEKLSSGKADWRVDIYSLGICLFEMITSQVPFMDEASTQDELISILERKSVPVNKYNDIIPQYVADIILKCCARLPDDRYQSYDEIIEELKRAALLANKDTNRKADYQETTGRNSGERQNTKTVQGATRRSAEHNSRTCEAIKMAIRLLKPEILLDRRLLISAIEDLAPDLASEWEFLKRTYNDDIGRLLYSAYTTDDRERYYEIDRFLYKDCGFNDDWRHRFFLIFSFMFSDVGKLSEGNQGSNESKIQVKQPDSKSHGSREISMASIPGSSKAFGPNISSASKSKADNKSVRSGTDKDILIFKAEAESVLSQAILNKNNHLYSITGELPKEVRKLLKYQNSGANAIENEKNILLVLTFENVFGIQDGIVVTKDHMTYISRSKTQQIYFGKLKDVKTYIQDAELAIKILNDDDSIISTDINSARYNIAPIVDFLMSNKGR